jgi:dephospho-CoA kinase
LKKIAVTGGIASGKTTVCELLRELGACVVHADAIGHELLSPSTELGKKVVAHFGQSVLKQGKIDRKTLANLAFHDAASLRWLEKLLHPAILHRIDELYEEACCSGAYKAFVVEIPLLYEIGQEMYYDLVVAVIADESVCRERFLKAGFSAEEYERRMGRQLPPEKKAQLADVVLYNNQPLDRLKKEVVKLSEKICA